MGNDEMLQGLLVDARMECAVDSAHALTRELHGAPSHASASSDCDDPGQKNQIQGGNVPSSCVEHAVPACALTGERHGAPPYADTPSNGCTEGVPLRVVELFAGIGAQRTALKNLGIPHDVVAIAEIDKHAIRAYQAIHGETRNLGDVSKIEHIPSCDLLT